MQELPRGALLVGGSALSWALVLLLLLQTPYTQRVLWPLPVWWLLEAAGSVFRAVRPSRTPSLDFC